MPGPNATNTYIGSFHFKVTVSGINDPFDGFTSCTGVKVSSETIEFKHGLDAVTRKGVGRTTYEPITLERVFAGYDEFFQWGQAIRAGNLDRREVKIDYLRNDGSVVTSFDLLGAWVSRWESPDLNATSSDGAMEKIELTYEVAIIA